jgi:hypothetical protein
VTPEGEYKQKLIKKLNQMFPGCIILKADPTNLQGIPDFVILWGDNWASLEIKTSATASVQPNQKWFIEKLDEMSYAAFIYPENEEEVLSALQQAFEPPRRARVSQS